MAWIESHQELGRHPKTRKAARALDVSIPTMVGHLHLLWWDCLDLAEDGDLSRWSHDDIAMAAAWHGNPDVFVEALLECGYAGGAGFLERDGPCGHPDEERTGDLVLHDWWEYAGKLVERRRRDRQRKSEARANSPPDDVHGLSDGQSADAPADASRARTRPDPTRPDPTRESVAAPARTTDASTASSSRRKRRSTHPLPADWAPTDRHREKAASLGVDPNAEAEAFRDHHLARDSRFADWNRAFHTWLNNTRKFGANGPPNNSQQPRTGPRAVSTFTGNESFGSPKR